MGKSRLINNAGKSKKIPTVLFSILGLALFCATAFAGFQSLQIATVTSSISFGEGIPPAITHTPLTNASAVTQIAIIQGTATDNDKLFKVQLLFKKPAETEFSTMTALTGSTDTFNFSFEIPHASVTIEGLEYRIVAQDRSGNRAFFPSSSTVQAINITGNITTTLGALGGTLSLPDGNPNDGATSITIPSGALDTPVNITIQEVSPSDPTVAASLKFTTSPTPLVVYRFLPDGLIFKKPVTITLLYKDIDQDGFLDGTSPPQSELSANMFYFDGVEWVVVGGNVDAALNTVTANVMHFTDFGIFASPPPAPQDLRPAQKIITPNGDGKNDIAIFGSLSPTTTIDIFDITGRRVRTLDGITIWDGRDSSNRIVESGPYIYQYTENGKLVSGIIVVAK